MVFDHLVVMPLKLGNTMSVPFFFLGWGVFLLGLHVTSEKFVVTKKLNLEASHCIS